MAAVRGVNARTGGSQRRPDGVLHQSSYGVNLAHTSLRPYVSRDQEQGLRQQLDEARLPKNHYHASTMQAQRDLIFSDSVEIKSDIRRAREHRSSPKHHSPPMGHLLAHDNVNASDLSGSSLGASLGASQRSGKKRVSGFSNPMHTQIFYDQKASSGSGPVRVFAEEPSMLRAGNQSSSSNSSRLQRKDFVPSTSQTRRTTSDVPIKLKRSFSPTFDSGDCQITTQTGSTRTVTRSSKTDERTASVSPNVDPFFNLAGTSESEAFRQTWLVKALGKNRKQVATTARALGNSVLEAEANAGTAPGCAAYMPRVWTSWNAGAIRTLLGSHRGRMGCIDDLADINQAIGVDAQLLPTSGGAAKFATRYNRPGLS